MTRELVSVPADVSIADAADTILSAHIRHLAVERDGEVLGIVSMRDLLEPLLQSRH